MSPEIVEDQGPEDHELIQRVAQRDKDVLEALYARYSTPVYSLAMYMLKQEALSHEVTQEIFLNIWLRASSYKPDRGPDPVPAAGDGSHRSRRL